MGCPYNNRYQEAQPGPQVLPAQDNIQNMAEVQIKACSRDLHQQNINSLLGAPEQFNWMSPTIMEGCQIPQRNSLKELYVTIQQKS